MTRTHAQNVALAIIPKCTGLLSLICSGLIVFSVLRSKEKRAQTYQRLLMGISIVDMSNSLWFGLSTWPIHADSAALFSAGNDVSCSMQGFFIQAGISAACYNGSLAVYYTLVLKYGWTEPQIRFVEPFLHALPLMWGLCTAIVSIPLQLYNNANLWCWISSYPAGCSGDDCVRGQNADAFRWGFYYGPLWANTFCLMVATLIIILHLRKSHAKTDTTENDELAEDEVSVSLLELVEKERRAHRGKERIIAMQFFLYTTIFCANWAPLTSVRTMQALDREIPFHLLAIAAFTAPFQGVLNLVVYTFPDFIHARQAKPNGNIISWFKAAL